MVLLDRFESGIISVENNDDDLNITLIKWLLRVFVLSFKATAFPLNFYKTTKWKISNITSNTLQMDQ